MSLPRRFGRYLLLDKIATGGMAEIFEARLIGVEGFEKPLAVKQILPPWSQKSDFVHMLIDEAKIAVRLNHPNIVQVYELGKEGDQYYLAMEIIDGVDLRELQKVCRISGVQIPLKLALWITSEMTEALVYAHELKDAEGRPLQIIHRDISPQNVLISFDGQVKITDFGIAKALDSSHETVTGAFKGKFAYMSPEQASQKKLDQRSDLFSLGIVFYELATGERLFGGSSDVSALDRARLAAVPTNEPTFQALPQSVRNILLKLLAKNKEDRPTSAAAVADLLKTLMAEVGTCDRQDLAQFMRKLLSSQQERRREDRSRVSKRLKEFLRDESLPSDGQEPTRTVLPQGPLPPDATQVLVTDWKKELSHHWWLRWQVRPGLWIGAGLSLVLLMVGIGLSLTWSERPQPASQATSPPFQEVKAGEGDDKSVVPETGSMTMKTPPEVKELRKEPVQEPTIREEQAVAAEVETVETKVPVKEAIPVKQPAKKASSPSKVTTTSFGRLSVQASPWAYVYIGNSKRRHETPMMGLKVATGPQRVRVVYPPTGTSLQRTVDINAGKSITCIARFGTKRSMTCQ